MTGQCTKEWPRPTAVRGSAQSFMARCYVFITERESLVMIVTLTANQLPLVTEQRDRAKRRPEWERKSGQHQEQQQFCSITRKLIVIAIVGCGSHLAMATFANVIRPHSVGRLQFSV